MSNISARADPLSKKSGFKRFPPLYPFPFPSFFRYPQETKTIYSLQGYKLNFQNVEKNGNILRTAAL